MITDWKQYRKHHGLAENTKIFIASNAYSTFADALIERGWHHNKNRKSPIFHLKMVVLERETYMCDNLQDWQIVNHFYGNNLITTKTGLQNSLKSLIWWSTVDVNDFFPRCFNMTDFYDLEDFKLEYRIIRSESLIKNFLKDQTSCKHY